MLPINSENKESVNLTEEDVIEARRIEDNPELILQLVDLIFLSLEEGKTIPS